MTNETYTNSSLLRPYIVASPPPPKIRGGGAGVLFLKFGQRGVHEKLLRNRGLVEKRDHLRKRGVSKLFHQFSLKKACFHYYWIVFVW